MTRGKRDAWVIVAVTVLVAVVRLALVVWNHADDPQRLLQNDSAGYLEPAQSLAEDLTYMEGLPERPAFLRTPGYPAFLTVLLRLTGDDIGRAVALQAVLSALAVPLVIATCRRLGLGLRWSVAAGLSVGLEPFQVATSGLVMTETLAALGMAASAYLLVRMVQSTYDWRWAAAAGASIGALTLVRPTTVYLPILLVVLFGIIAFRSVEPELRRRVVLSGLAAVVLAVALPGLWSVRNLAEFGTWRLSSAEAITYYWYRAGGIRSEVEGIPWDPDARLELTRELNPELSRDEAMEVRRGELPEAWVGREAEYYDRATSRAFEIFREHPLVLAKQTVNGLRSMVLSSGWPSAAAVFGYHEAPRILSLVGVALVAGFVALAVFGAVVRLARGPNRAEVLWTVVLSGYVVLASAGYQAVNGHRFRAPLWPAIVVYAALGAAWLWQQLPLDRERPASTRT